MTYLPGQFSQIERPKANRWLNVSIGMEFRVDPRQCRSRLENLRSNKYLQLHWHMAMWTNNPDGLEAKLKLIFRKAQKYERPFDLKITRNLDFLRLQI